MDLTEGFIQISDSEYDRLYAARMQFRLCSLVSISLKKKLPHLSFRKGKGFKCKSVKRTDWKIPSICPMDCKGYAKLLQLPFHLQFVVIRMHFKFHSVSTHSCPCVGVWTPTHTHTVGTDEYKCPLVHSFFCFWAAGFVAAAVPPFASIWALPCLALNRLGWAGLGWAFFYRLHNACSLPFISCMCLCVCVCVTNTLATAIYAVIEKRT